MGWVQILGRRLRPSIISGTLLVFLLQFPRMEITGYTGVPWVLGSQSLAAFTASSEEILGWVLVSLALLVALPLLVLFRSSFLSGAYPLTVGGKPFDLNGPLCVTLLPCSR